MAFSSARAAAAGQRVEGCAELLLVLDPERAAGLGDRRGQDHQGRHLGDERLGGGHRDLGAGLQEEDRSRLAGDRAADRVGDGDDRAAPRSRASRVGAIVSAVSPDWVTAITRVRSSSGGGL